METSIPSTPPGNLEVHYQLPTPSSTAGSQKRIPCWLEDVAQQKRKRLQQFKDTEKDALSGYDEIQDNETYGITVSEASDTSSVSPLSIRCPAISDFSASISWGSHTGLSPQFFNRHGNFPFMSLPPNVRNRIYRLLLVVPAIICVRQKHTGYRTDKTPYIYTEPREFLPGIAYALGQFAVDGSKFRVCRFGTINTHILSVSKKIHAETKVILYGANSFEITAPCFEMNPAPNYTIPLFPRDCQYLVRNLVIRVRAFYPLQWIANGGYAELKCAYRSLDSLHIIFELDSMAKGLGRRLARKEEELWVPYGRSTTETFMEKHTDCSFF